MVRAFRSNCFGDIDFLMARTARQKGRAVAVTSVVRSGCWGRCRAFLWLVAHQSLCRDHDQSTWDLTFAACQALLKPSPSPALSATALNARMVDKNSPSMISDMVPSLNVTAG